jgi:hypothetical protein
MSTTPQTAQDDLAFMRSLIKSGDGFNNAFGEAYFAAGVCYFVQMLLSAGQLMAWLPTAQVWYLAIGLGPTVVFLPILAWIIWRGRRAAPTGVVGKTIAAVFGAAGLANLALVAVIGSVAARQHSATTWLIYPCAVFVIQGAAWMVAYALRHRFWLALVGAGWFATAIAMALNIEAMPWFILWAGLGMLLFMAVPGAVMIRLARRHA